MFVDRVAGLILAEHQNKFSIIFFEIAYAVLEFISYYATVTLRLHAGACRLHAACMPP
jgi:hypothetical protein